MSNGDWTYFKQCFNLKTIYDKYIIKGSRRLNERSIDVYNFESETIGRKLSADRLVCSLKVAKERLK